MGMTMVMGKSSSRHLCPRGDDGTMIRDVDSSPSSSEIMGSTMWITIGGPDGRLAEYFSGIMIVMLRSGFSISGPLIGSCGSEGVDNWLVISESICWMI